MAGTHEHDALTELEGLDLGDARRTARVRGIVAALQRDPAAHFPTAVRTLAAREAVYRIFNNPGVTAEALLAPHREQTIGRMHDRAERPIIAIDKTSFVFKGETEREGLEWISKTTQGFDAFFALALSPTRRPLGILAVQPLETRGASSAGEWAAFVDVADVPVERAEDDPIFVMDREADAYELFANMIAAQRDFVVRVGAARWIHEQPTAEKELLRKVVQRAPVKLTRTVKLTRRGAAGRSSSEKRKYPPREAREAVLSVRACSVIVPRTLKASAALPDQLKVQLLQITELDPPADYLPIEWLLVTTLPISDAASVAAIVDAYRARWRIEEYFKALKTGCNYEKRQLESRHALLNALGILAPLAWRLLALKTLADDDPTASATTLLDADELHVLRKLSTDIKLAADPPISEVIRSLARLGGHFPQNGRPGWLVIGRGLEKVLDTTEGYRLAKAEM